MAALLAQLDGLAARQTCFHNVRRCTLDRPNLFGIARRHSGARAAASGTAARHRQGRIHTIPGRADPHITTLPLTRLDRRDGAALVDR